MTWWRCVFVILLLASSVCCRRHKLALEDDARKNIHLSTFGFLKNGVLMVNVSGFSYTNSMLGKLSPEDQGNNFIFSLEKTASDGAFSYLESSDSCVTGGDQLSEAPNPITALLFTLNLASERITIQRFGPDFEGISISNRKIPDKPLTVLEYIQWLVLASSVTRLLPVSVTDSKNVTTEALAVSSSLLSQLPLQRKTEKKKSSYSGVFTIAMQNESETGLYNLYFQNCKNYGYPKAISVNMQLSITEVNDHTYLSAGELHLPVVYGLMSNLFFMTGCLYVSFLKSHRTHSFKGWTFKKHYLMASLVFLKSASLFYHAGNLYWIGQDGSPVELWAVLDYVTHLLNGVLLFTTIALIGTGLRFIKESLFKKDKLIIMIIIPLQIMSNVAQIMSESTEEGKAQYMTWKQIFFSTDIICCFAIIFPVTWSLRHLQRATKTDEKASGIKLFKHLYVMIVCYIYFTRIVVYLIKISVPFRYMWLDEFLTEMGTYLFLVDAGYRLFWHDVQMVDLAQQTKITESFTPASTLLQNEKVQRRGMAHREEWGVDTEQAFLSDHDGPYGMPAV